MKFGRRRVARLWIPVHRDMDRQAAAIHVNLFAGNCFLGSCMLIAPTMAIYMRLI